MDTQINIQTENLNSSDILKLHSHLINEQHSDTVNSRDLHAFLELGRDFVTWIKARISQYKFVEGEDFLILDGLSSPKRGSSKSRLQKTKDYFITLDMAKELAMVERNEKGREARRYFIDCERQLKATANPTPAIEASQASLNQLADTSNQKPLQDVSKYKILNGIIKSMEFNDDVVVVPAIEMVNLIRVIRKSQKQIAKLQSPDRMNEQIDIIKTCTNRNLMD